MLHLKLAIHVEKNCRLFSLAWNLLLNYSYFCRCLLTTILISGRPKENEKIREELEKSIHIIWNCRLPSPRVSEEISFLPSYLLFSMFLALSPLLHIFFSLDSKQCVAIDAVVDVDLVSALQVSVYPQLIFTKSGKILYREKGILYSIFF